MTLTLYEPSPGGPLLCGASSGAGALRPGVPAAARWTGRRASQAGRLALLLLWLTGAATAAPRHVYLTWQSDPTTTITVNYHERDAAAEVTTEVRYDTVSRGGDPDAYAWRAAGDHRRLAKRPRRTVHRVELTELTPGRRYWFVAGDPVGGFSAERAVRTLPDGDGPLRFVVGGDMGIGEQPRQLQRAAAAHEPQFAVVGGDIAYADGDWNRIGEWDKWFDNWGRLMVTPDGLTVPIVAVIGNHEVAGGYNGSPEDAPFYLAFFPQGTAHTYFARHYGPRVFLVVLDSGHLQPHGGRQSAWLESQLAAHADAPVRLAAYHVPLFPSFRPASGRYAAAGRQHWQPLFDRFGVMAAFEHHDHAFKRTHPIRATGVDGQGTLYLGDGSWGRGPRWVRGPRKTHLARRWYIDRLEAEGHVWRVDVGADSVVFGAVDKDGEIFDRLARPID